MPLNQSGKVDRQALRKLLEQRSGMSLQPAADSPARGEEQASAGFSSGKKNLRDLLAIDERPQVVVAAQTWLGQLAIFLVAALAACSFEDWWLAALLVGLAMAYARLPKYRDWILLGGTWTAALLALCLAQNDIQENIRQMMVVENVDALSPLALGLLAMATFFVGAWSVLAMSRRDKTLFVARRPVLALLVSRLSFAGSVR
jgi:hypothetical protein